MEEESLRHNVIMILLDVLLNSEQPITLKELVSKLGHYSDYNTFSKGLRRMTGRGVEGLPGILILLWQYPSLFTVTSGKVWFTSSFELVSDDQQMLENESRIAVDFYEFQMKRLGAYSVPITRLFDMQSQASRYVKQITGQSISQLTQFLKSHPNVFAFMSDDCVVLCEHLSRAEINGHTITRIDAPIELDEEVYNNTRIIVNTYHGRQIIDHIFQTANLVTVDLEGVNLGSVCGSITLVQLAFLPKHLMHTLTTETSETTTSSSNRKVYPRIYIFDIHSNPDLIDFCLKRLLESNKIKKVFHGCEDDSYALHRDYGVVLNNFLDTQAAHTVINTISNGQQTEAIGLNGLFERYGGFGCNPLKAVVKKRYVGNSQYWCYRPLTEEMIYYAAYDVYVLLGIYLKMHPFISQIKGQYEDLLEELNKKSAFSRIWAEQDRHQNRTSFYQNRRRPFHQRRPTNSNNNYSPNFKYNKSRSNRF